MTDKNETCLAGKPAIGGELVVPAMAVTFAIYFLIDINDLVWEAKANATVIAYVLLGLIAIHLVRIVMRVRSGDVTLAVGDLIEPRLLIPIRLLVLAATAVFVIALPWLGLTLGLFLLVAILMRLLRAGSWRRIITTASLVSISAYLVFIALLSSRLPHGPVEKLLAGLL